MSSLTQICVSCTRDNHALIKTNARKAGYASVSAYLVALGTQAVTVEPVSLDALIDKEAGAHWLNQVAPYSKGCPDRFSGIDTHIALARGEMMPVWPPKGEGRPEKWMWGSGLYTIIRSGSHKVATKIETLSPVAAFALANKLLTFPRLPELARAYQKVRRTAEYVEMSEAFTAEYGRHWTSTITNSRKNEGYDESMDLWLLVREDMPNLSPETVAT